MSANLANAFNQLLGIHFRQVTLERPGTTPVGPVSIKVTPANFSRNYGGPEEVTIKGREFVITKSALDAAVFPAPRKGDRIRDPDLGLNVVQESIEIYGFGGHILGYRVRCG